MSSRLKSIIAHIQAFIRGKMSGSGSVNNQVRIEGNFFAARVRNLDSAKVNSVLSKTNYVSDFFLLTAGTLTNCMYVLK